MAKACEARRIRAAARHELRVAGPRVGAVFDEVVDRAQHDEAIAKMRVAALIEALPGIGKIRAAEIMSRLEISPSRRIRGLGAKQRSALMAELTDGSRVARF